MNRRDFATRLAAIAAFPALIEKRTKKVFVKSLPDYKAEKSFNQFGSGKRLCMAQYVIPPDGYTNMIQIAFPTEEAPRVHEIVFDRTTGRLALYYWEQNGER